MIEIVLASQSPARLATLRSAGVEPRVVVSGIDEDIDADSPAALAGELAVRKAAAVAERLGAAAADRVVIGCDSVLELDGVAYGKPGDRETAIHRWQAMRGRDGVLHTGHHLVVDRGGATRTVSRVASTTVSFAEVTDAEIEAYVDTGEPLVVAGAFTLDGLGGAFVTGIVGDPHTVVGISLPLLRTMLAEVGVSWPELWAPR